MSNIVTQIKVVLWYYIITLRTGHIYINLCTMNTLIIRGLLNQNQNQIDRWLLLKVNHILSGSRGFPCYNSTTLEWCNVFSCSSPFVVSFLFSGDILVLSTSRINSQHCVFIKPIRIFIDKKNAFPL